jgi:hypothetical protein
MENIKPLKFNSPRKVIEVQEWDRFVSEVYGRPYAFQQQSGCKSRGTFDFEVLSDYEPEDYENDTVPENVNDEKMGVSFKAWLERDPKQKLTNPEGQQDYCLTLWWNRNFYPDVSMIIEDLHAKGLLEKGDYTININW